MQVRTYIRANRPWTFKKQIDHPTLGLIWYNQVSGSVDGYYQGQYFFPPANKRLDFILDSKKEGPGQAELAFLKRLEVDFPKIESELADRMVEQLQMSDEKIKEISSLEVIVIRSGPSEEKSWEIVYWLNNPIAADLTFKMKGLKVKEIITTANKT